jgi:hypothetical protein
MLQTLITLARHCQRIDPLYAISWSVNAELTFALIACYLIFSCLRVSWRAGLVDGLAYVAAGGRPPGQDLRPAVSSRQSDNRAKQNQRKQSIRRSRKTP